jgi:hypothetical protein
MWDMRKACKIFLNILKGGDHSEDLCTYVRIILKYIFMELRFGAWILESEDTAHWWAFVNTVMNPRVALNVGNFLIRKAYI